LRDAERADELADAAWAVEQDVEDPQACRLGEHGEQAVGGRHGAVEYAQ
jgi:hypothetical protein